ncbi:winged helix DNA-binding protein [Novosphingobium mangrovi (ex Huang et al. 2023)]|uniref:Winged helix DNA-binding protein n=1 Tax=Novosphingobium mangrovi (ex Huang et al. 2023) TaxID=2976432 RepID=A0ABT2I5T0_9SPHN|nr:winged helix DNA-binding protein [Novosphingobium mangrovi (ex Huang et al. 2023)]MCT2400175.1 winged helix DNA-binding protein [Novosphingobium mangrovi (ex Huang et al. 2023)]
MTKVAKQDLPPTKRIKVLADELNELISQIETSQLATDDAEDLPEPPTVQDWLEAVLDAYNMRRQREKIFEDCQLFGEPTWDILLDLFIAELKNTRMQTTSVCIGAQVPQTTALRWIALLEREGLVHRYKDRNDSRRVYIQLTERALRKMVDVFYERCLIMRNRTRNKGSRNRLSSPDTSARNEARNTLLNETVARIRSEKVA